MTRHSLHLRLAHVWRIGLESSGKEAVHHTWTQEMDASVEQVHGAVPRKDGD